MQAGHLSSSIVQLQQDSKREAASLGSPMLVTEQHISYNVAVLADSRRHWVRSAYSRAHVVWVQLAL